MWTRGNNECWTSDCYHDVTQVISDTKKDTIVLLLDNTFLARALIPLLQSAVKPLKKNFEIWFPCKSDVEFKDVEKIQMNYRETVCLFYVDDEEDMDEAVKRFMKENSEKCDVFFSGPAMFPDTYCLAYGWFKECMVEGFRGGYEYCLEQNKIPYFTTND